MKTNLDQLYSLRKNFSVIGLTGRTGSGCSDIATVLSKKFSSIGDIENPENFKQSVFKKKYQIVYNFTKHNWKKYKIIDYEKVLFLLLIPRLYKNPENTLLFEYYRFRLKDETDTKLIVSLKKKIQEKILTNRRLVIEIKNLGTLTEIKNETKLKSLNDIFWGPEFNNLSDEINTILTNNGFIERIMLMHHTANNIRKSGDPFKNEDVNPDHIYKISKVINRIIKATKQEGNDNCHIVIDSLKNSLEINFFKERYSAFYLVAVKNDARKSKLTVQHDNITEAKIDRLIEIDDAEYRCGDYQKGIFYTPDLQNCIQIADYHINNKSKKKRKDFDSFLTLGEQLLKFQGLIQQPGLITPDPTERVMQLAYTAKLNSGCISRQVGAVVTNNEFSTKAIGWNDVPKGTIPCSVRNIKDISEEKPFGFTKFELGKGLKETEQINDDKADKLIDNESKKFHDFIKNNYNEKAFPTVNLGGRNCPYCFKTAYNTFSGEKNQVHTRSLHAEENAMMQISRSGGQGLKNGYLFTSASPCELCAKKAYQLGIKTIFYIDPYPGISRDHILKSNKKTDPKMILFSGAVGRAYHKLYEPFLSQKDELSLLTKFRLRTPQNVMVKSLKSILKNEFEDKNDLIKKLDNKLGKDVDAFDNFIKIIEKGLE